MSPNFGDKQERPQENTLREKVGSQALLSHEASLFGDKSFLFGSLTVALSDGATGSAPPGRPTGVVWPSGWSLAGGAVVPLDDHAWDRTMLRTGSVHGVLVRAW